MFAIVGRVYNAQAERGLRMAGPCENQSKTGKKVKERQEKVKDRQCRGVHQVRMRGMRSDAAKRRR